MASRAPTAPLKAGAEGFRMPKANSKYLKSPQFLTKPYAPGGTTKNETYDGLKIVYTEDESEYTKGAAKVENRLGQQLVD